MRECARAQGFPDHWRFLSVNDRPNRIVDDVRVLSPPLPVPPVLTACDPAVPMPAIVELIFFWRTAAVGEQQYRQIGNAVPVPLARALGGALGETLLRAWRAEEAAAGDAVAVLREGSPEV